MTTTKMPAAYITHGGGPCFFMDWDPPDAWDDLRAALEGIAPSLPRTPRAIVVVTAHWEAPQISIASGSQPGLIYDYGGFPPHTYRLTYPAPGDPDLAARIAALAGPDEVLLSGTTRDLLEGAGLDFEDRGTHEFKGLAAPRQVFALVRVVRT